ELFPEIDVCDFTTAKLNNRLNSIPFPEEANCVITLEFVVVIVRIRTEFQFLYLNYVLLLLGVVLLLLILVLPLAIIHRLGDRRLSGRRNKNQIQTKFLGSAD